MTYNFDPDQWFARELSVLEAKRKSGAIDQAAFDTAHEQLMEAYEKMLDRVDTRHDYYPTKK